MINTTSGDLKEETFFICLYYSFYEWLKSHAQLSYALKNLYNPRGLYEINPSEYKELDCDLTYMLSVPKP